MTKKHYILSIMLLLMPMIAQQLMAQEVCNFETKDYKSIRVYDDWINSPFNIGKLNGNLSVIDNNLKNEINNSEKILAIQCSRYASNIFGAAIELNKPIELNPTVKYVHVKLHRPMAGKAMLVGLGKRIDSSKDQKDIAQFHSLSTLKVGVNDWDDAVFPIKGNGGILISTLVVVPFAESPHNVSEDFIAYIDDIEISDSPLPRNKVGDYFINMEETTELKRDDRKLEKVGFTGDKGGSMTYSAPNNKLLYRNSTDKVLGNAVAGETITPSIQYKGVWMHGYVYFDKGNDGKFTVDLEDNGTPKTNSDVVSYTYYNGKNSTGTDISNQNPGFNNMPSFTIPADTKPGIYRMRFKVDWDNIDAGGSIKSDNHIVNNGGGIIDVLVNIHNPKVNVKIKTRNGDVMTSSNEVFAESNLPFGESIQIGLRPEKGFKADGVTIKHGYINNPEFIHSNIQWRIDTIAQNNFVDNKYTIPTKLVDGDMEITAEFAEATGVENIVDNSNVKVTTTPNSINVTVTKSTDIQLCDISGKLYFRGEINDKKSFELPKGIYLLNNLKVTVR